MDVASCSDVSEVIESPEPEQLGSVTHSHDSDGSVGLQIRSSARVSKKLRLDLVPPPPPDVTKIPVAPPPPEEVKTPEGIKPRRRNWELWSSEDKDTFFEALNELGKDFDAIQNHFAVKGRKKGVAEQLIKNKDQIRHFYYRTWHKVSKHLKFSDDVKKGAQELYALVNYGELRKKLGSINEKTSVKLNELIRKGSTQVRSKGKTLRIKTPLCRALRRINQMEDCLEVAKLPARVTVELRPRTNEAWSRVQASARNPRVRTSVPLQKRLSSLIAFLSRSWSPPQQKLRSRLESALGCPSTSPPNPPLRLAPRPAATICAPAVNLSEYLTSTSLSLDAYEERASLTQPAKQPAAVVCEAQEPSEAVVEKVRRGWTLEDAGATSVGELYLMFGNKATLALDYWWEPVGGARRGAVGDTLQTLLSVAKLTLRKARVVCPCGHTCGGVAKPRPHPPLRPLRAHEETQQEATQESDGVFLRPMAPGSVDAFKAQLDNFRPRYCNRRGRTLRPKNVVVQRMLPLLPKTLVTVNLLPPLPQPVPPAPPRPVVEGTTVLPSLPSLDTPVPSPPSISHLLQDHQQVSLTADFTGLISHDGVMQTPPTSPSRILKETDNQWLNSEVADFSLSSFLGHLDSPLKHEPSRLTDVDTQLQSLMTENSVDYMAKFADLAAQIASNDLNNKK